MALPGVSVQQHRLGQGHQSGAEYPLKQAEQDQLIQGRGRAAQHGGHREAADRPQEKPLPAQAGRQDPGRRRHDGGRHDIGGEYPGNLVLRGGERALHVR